MDAARFSEILTEAAACSRSVVYIDEPNIWITKPADIPREPYQSLIEPTIYNGRELVVHQGCYSAQNQRLLPEFDIKSVWVLPLKTERKPFGACCLGWYDSRLSHDLLRHIRQFVELCSVGLENRRLWNQSETLYNRFKVNRKQLKKRIDFPELVGNSDAIEEVYKKLRRVIAKDVSVLILGKSGTGKELVAQAIHYYGARAHHRFVPIDCGAIPSELLESELFGYKKGTFTGARTDKVGLFESAHHGTLFLDEITNMTPALQAKLLRALQEKSIRRLGDAVDRPIDIQLISATNKDLKTEVEAGRFREDLYYRLKVVTIKLPPLQQRVGDIPILLDHFMEKISRKLAIEPKKFHPDVVEKLQAYDWPGNIRELENIIERLLILSMGKTIQPVDLPNRIIGIDDKPVTGYRLCDHEKALILRVLRKTRWNIKKAAELLSISRTTLYSKLEKHGLNLKEKRRT